MKILTSFFLLLIAPVLFAAPDLTLAWKDLDRSEPNHTRYRTFHSATLNDAASFLIYLPPDYHTNTTRRYPVVYWLHGLGGNQRTGAPFVARLDKAVRSGDAPPMIAVLVNGLRASMYTDSKDGRAPVESVIVRDLVPHVDGQWRTIATPEARAIEGFSMGGFGAARLGMKHPGTFGVVSILAGALHNADSIASRRRGIFESVYGSDKAYFRESSPWTLLEKNADAIRDTLRIRLWVGQRDGLLDWNREYHGLMEELRIPADFGIVEDAGHSYRQLANAWSGRLFAFYKTAFADLPEQGKEPDWDVDHPPGPRFEQSIDSTEGTWINLDVSPDGRDIVFDFLGDLYVMPLADPADGSPRQPANLTGGIAWDMQPRFSPDGAQIVFTSDRTGKSKRGGDNIWIMNRDGSDVRQITDESFRLLNGPGWHPSGDYIVARKHFTSRRSLGAGEMWMYHKSGVSQEAQGGVQLTKRDNDQKDVNEPVFSPDGKHLYYSQDATPGSVFEYDKDSNKQIYVIKRLELDTGKTRTCIAGPGGACRPVPSPDGKTIAFVRRVGEISALHLFDVDSGAVRVLYQPLERDMQEAWAIHGVYPSFAWTPDGASIVVWSQGKIRQINVADGNARVLAFHIKDTRAMVRSLRHQVAVAPERFDVRSLRWVGVAPDDRRVVFQALGHIYIRSLPDGTPMRLTSQFDHFEYHPRFTRDGNEVVYVSWNDEQLGQVRLAPADPLVEDAVKILTPRPGHYRDPVVSPDGKTVVYQAVGGGYLVSPLWSQEQGLFRQDVAGGEPVLLSESGSRPQFGAGSDRVFFLRRKGGKDADNLQLVSTDLNGKEERVHFNSKWATDYRISPDGGWIAFIERFHVHVSPFVQTGKTIEIGPKNPSLPVVQLSEEAGDWIHFSGDSRRLHWSLGPTLYSQDLNGAFRFLEGAPGKAAAVRETPIGFSADYDRPKGTLVLKGGRLVTMGPAGTIENGVIVIQENRITQVGAIDAVRIPGDAEVIDVGDQVVLPGFVDTHAHGSQGVGGVVPQQNWMDFARLAFGVTTIHDPSNDTKTIFAASEMAKAGRIVAPRTFSTGTILYGAAGSQRAEVNSLKDAAFHLKRMQAVGAFTVKSYNQPRRDQRQQVVAAARDMPMMVVPEGGSTFMHNMTMIVDGHTGIEHTLPVQNIYDDVRDLWRGTGVGYTPTLSVAFGGLSGEIFWYDSDDLWRHERLAAFTPKHVLMPRARRRLKAPLEDYNHIKVAGIAKQLVDLGGLVQAGGHGQLNGICTHWEMWSFVQGGMTPMEALRCGTLFGARYIGLDKDLGSLEAGKLADIIVVEKGFDPTTNIRHSEQIQHVILNGRLFDARTMNAAGQGKRKPFYWEHDHSGVATAIPATAKCVGCNR